MLFFSPEGWEILAGGKAKELDKLRIRPGRGERIITCGFEIYGLEAILFT
jgi:hypothetical protein